jgi:RHS repeat-associated protein
MAGITPALRRAFVSFVVVVVVGVLAGAARVVPLAGAAAGAAGQAADPASGVELASLRTRFSRTFVDRANGRATVVSSAPVNFRDSSGSWKPIDTSLASAAGGYTNAANSFGLSLPSELSHPISLSAGSASLSLSLVGGAGAGSASGSSVTYAGALSGVDLRLDSEAQGLEFSLRLASSSAPSAYQFATTVSGAGVPTVEGGAVTYSDEKDVPVFVISAAFARDAAGAVVPVHVSATGSTLTFSVDPVWLASPGRAFPVVIDPTISPTPTADCTLASATPDASQCSASTLDVGFDGSHASRSALKFDLSAIPPDAIVLNAQLQMYLASASTSTATSVSAYGLTRAFSSAATWNRYDGTNSWTSAGGDYAGSPSVSASAGAASATTISWWPAALVQSWVNGSATNDGFLLKQDGESTSQLLHFNSSEATSNRPSLTVYWQYRVGEQRQYTYFPQAQLNDRLGLQVNVANGNLMLQESALHLAGTGLDLDLALTYNNLSGTSWQLGNGWNLSVAPFAKLFFFGDGSVRYWDPSGAEVRFQKNADGSYTAPTAIDATLSSTASPCPSGDYKLTFNKSGVIWCFLSWGGADQLRDRNGNTISFAWSAGNLSTITDSKGATTTFAYSSDGSRITSITDPTSRVVRFGYSQNSADGSWNLTSYTDAASKVTSFTYSTANDLTKITTPAGTVTDIAYSADGWYHAVSSITRETDTSAHTGPTAAFSIGASDSDCPSGAAGKTTVTLKDHSGAAIETNKFCFDHQDRVIKSYDGLNRPSSADLTPGGSFDSSDPASGTNNQGGVTNYTYAAGTSSDGSAGENLTQVQGPANSSGNRATWSAQYNDSANPFAPTMNSDTNGSRFNYAYDSNGSLCAKSEGTVTTTLNCTGGSGQGQNQLTFQHDSKGQILSATDANGHSTSYSYDSGATHNLIQITPPSPLGTNTFSYDSANRVSTVTDGKSQTITYSYDNLDRVTSIVYKNSSGVTYDTMSYSYDDDGNLHTRLDATGTETFGYDKLNRLTSDQKPSGTTVAYSYDDANRLASVDDSGTGGQTVSYAYDAANRVTSITEPGSKTTTYSYQDAPTVTNPTVTITYPNSASVLSSFDTSGRLLSIVDKDGSGATVASFAYSYGWSSGTKDGSLRQSVTDNAGATTYYCYDSAARLTRADSNQCGTSPSASAYQYTYDPTGNMTSKTIAGTTTNYTVNAANELTNSGYSYDANGNLTASPSFTGFTYNPKNQTTQINPTSGGTTLNITYAGQGQADRVTANSTGDSASFIDDQLGIAEVNSSAQGIATWFTRDPSGRILGERCNGNYYYLFDGLGSVIAATNATGTVIRTFKYDPYGNTTNTTGTLFEPIRYAGYYLDYQTNLYKAGQRYYDPTTSRWTQQDSINNALDTHGWNQYDYAGDDPVNSVDPSGAATIGLCVSGGAARLAKVAGLGSGCVVTDFHSVGVTGTVGGGAQIGSPWWGVGIQATNAHDIRELRGPFGYVGGGYGRFGGGAFGGPCAGHAIVGGDFSVGNEGAEVHAGGSNTWVHRIYSWGPSRARC